MKILHVTPLLGPANGGSGVVPLELAKRQVRRGHEITIATSDHNFDSGLICPSSGISINKFECSSMFRSSFYTPRMRKWLKDNIDEYDVVHLHNLRSYQSILVRKYAGARGTPYLIQAHGTSPIGDGKEMMKKVFDGIWTKRLIARASGLIAVSEKEIDHYTGMGADRSLVHVIPNALEASDFTILPAEGTFRRRYHIPPQEQVILYLGRLNARKGIDGLIRAFSRVHRERESAVLIICGPDDGYEQELRDLAHSLGLERAVRFLGFVKDRMSAYVDADILAYPAKNEIFGLVPFEAVMCGTPVIVTNDCGCGDIVVDAKCGIIIPMDDDDALFMAICHLLDHPDEGREMVSSGRRFIQEQLTWERAMERLDRAYAIAIHGKK